jgi:hypothetical protein
VNILLIDFQNGFIYIDKDTRNAILHKLPILLFIGHDLLALHRSGGFLRSSWVGKSFVLSVDFIHSGGEVGRKVLALLSLVDASW